MSLIPVKIQSFLVPYLFEKYDGKEAYYRGVHVKQITITQRKALGKYIRLFCSQAEDIKNNTEFNIYISVSTEGWKGSVYKYADGRRSFLMLPAKAQDVLNEMFKEEFYNSFFFYVNGFAQSDQVKLGIMQWMDRYNLLEFGFSYIALERRYNREKSKRERNAEFIDLSVDFDNGRSNLAQ